MKIIRKLILFNVLYFVLHFVFQRCEIVTNKNNTEENLISQNQYDCFSNYLHYKDVAFSPYEDSPYLKINKIIWGDSILFTRELDYRIFDETGKKITQEYGIGFPTLNYTELYDSTNETDCQTIIFVSYCINDSVYTHQLIIRGNIPKGKNHGGVSN